MSAAKKRSVTDRRLAQLIKQAAKAKPGKLHELLVDVAVLFAGAGRRDDLVVVLGWLYGGRIPMPREAPTALSTPMLTVVADAAGLGDVTRGSPSRRGEPDPRSHAERLGDAEREVRGRLLGDHYTQRARGDWRALPEGDPWRMIDAWREVQSFARGGDDGAAIAALSAYLEALPAASRGAGYGDELVLALDLATRLGREAEVPAWLDRHGKLLLEEPLVLTAALCLPAVARAALAGLLRPAIALEASAALVELEAAVDASLARTPPAKVPRVQKRRVGAEYAQFHLAPAAPTAEENAQVFFQRAGESEEGMSRFPTKVAVATPGDTAHIDVEVTIAKAAPPDLEGAVRAVSFPLEVRGPLVLTSVSDDDPDEPLVVPPGRYDVLARFFPKKASKENREAGLRVYAVRLSFHPAGALDAPRSLLLGE